MRNYDSPLGRELHSMSANALAVPISGLIEPKAREWIKSDDLRLRDNGNRLLAACLAARAARH
jgi:hypothetical protein